TPEADLMTTATHEATRTFRCFGSRCTVFVIGDGAGRTAARAVEHATRRLLAWHERFTRFDPASELSRLNADPRGRVPVSPVMARFAQAVLTAGERTGGLVDATLVTELEDAGYRTHLDGASLPLELALRLAPARRPASLHAGRRRRGDERHRRAQLARRRAAARAPPARPRDRTPGLHRRRPGHRAGPHRARGRAPRQGRRARRLRARGRLAAPRR